MTSISLLTLVFILLPSCLAESWTITVYTGRRRFAGTDSNVYISLINSKKTNSKEQQLTHYNWIPEKNVFPVRNLFEMGAKDRFRIWTGNLETIDKILIRRDNYLPFQADWLLDQVIVESDTDGRKYTFKCDCWLRRDRPYITLSPFFEQKSEDQSQTKKSSGSFKRAFIIILLFLISIIIGMLCFYHEYRRRQQHSALSTTDTNEQIHQETSCLDSCHPQAELPLSRTQNWLDTIRHWKDLPARFSSDRRSREIQSSTTVPAVASRPALPTSPGDEPPSYEDLYPNQNARNSTL
ncbi:unnamed protein product [Adineta ricciae]|uniref:PLAT domain-containing protein n=1 Tax=Adineta ricciae TaxID=249248 RepID=A0A813XFF0_ADIRI|nr:unnamed protein product [Adineta ricciae]CAF1571090.1 unnamed protein product [Adineta ricciae]